MSLDRDRELTGHSGLSLGRRAGWLTLGRISHTAALLLVGAILSRALPPEEYGQYQQAWVYLNIAIPLFLFGMPVSLSYFLAPAEGPARDRRAARHVLLILLFAALFALCAGGLWMGAAAFSIPAEVRALMPAGILIGAGMIACGFLEPVLIVYGRHRVLAGSLLLFAALHLTAVLAGWFLGGSLESIFACLGGSVVLRVVWSYLLLFRLLRPLSLDLVRQPLEDPLKYAWRVGLRDGIEVLSRFVDKLIFLSFFTTAQFAFYHNGAWEIPVVIFVHSMLAVLLPELRVACSRGDMGQVLNLMHFAARRVALVLFPAAAFAFSVAPELTSFLFGEDYRDSGAYLRVFLLLLPLRVSTAGLVLLAANRTRAVLLGTGVDLVLAAVLGVALVPWLGTLAPAVALVVSTSCQVGFYNWRASTVIGRPLPEVLPWPVLGRLALPSVAAALGAALCARFESALLNLMAAGIVFVLLLCGLGLGLRLFDARERVLLGAAARSAAARFRSVLLPRGD